MTDRMVSITIKTVFPGEVIKALRREADRMRKSARFPDPVDRFDIMSADFKADELERVVNQITRSK